MLIHSQSLEGARAYNISNEDMRLVWELTTHIPMHNGWVAGSQVLKVDHALCWASICRVVHDASRDFRMRLQDRKRLARSLCVHINEFFNFLLCDVWASTCPHIFIMPTSKAALMVELNDMFNSPLGGFSSHLCWVLQKGFSPRVCLGSLLLLPLHWKDPFVHKRVASMCILNGTLRDINTSMTQIASRLREIRQGRHTCLQSFYEELLPHRPIIGTIHSKGWPNTL